MLDNIEATAEMPSGGKVSAILRNISVVSIYIIAFLTPLFYLPITADPIFGKTVLVSLLAAAAFLAWLARGLIRTQISYFRSPLFLALLFFLAALGVSSFFSLDPHLSFFVSDPTGERLLSFAAFAVCAFLIASEFSRAEVRRLAGAIIASTIVFSLFIFFNVLPIIALPAVLRNNPVGSLNNSAAVLGALFLFSLGALLFKKSDPEQGAFFTALAWIAAIICAADLLLINFRFGWIALAAACTLFFAFHSSRAFRVRRETGAYGSFAPPVGVSLVILLFLAASILLGVFTLPVQQFFPKLQSELEVTPALQSSFQIALQEIKERPVFGSGPGTFLYDYSRFHSSAVNQTIFWNVQFTHGYSFLLTALATTGVLGIVGLLLVIIFFGYAVWSGANRMPDIGPLEFSFGMAALFGIILWGIYSSTFVMNLLIFFAIGGFCALIPRDAATETPRWRAFGRRSIAVHNQWGAFFFSLAVVAITITILLAEATLVERYVADVYFANGSSILSLTGNADNALAKLATASALDPQNDQYFALQAEINLALAQQTLNQVVAGNTAAQAAFQSQLNNALELARKATALNPNDAAHWVDLGMMYETTLPFVDGADAFAVQAYQQAIHYAPSSPVAPTLIGRTYISLVDLTNLRAQQQAISQKDAELKIKSSLDAAKTSLEQAVALKSDYAAAEFLLAQAFTREGNLDEAIRRGTNAALAAPQDIGVAFFLGFLYYQKGDLASAETEFSRAIAINSNYSNARYFLGLIYDRLGQKQDAIAQFRKVYELNPDNDEVRKIIANLEANKPALTGIAPPPEQRTEPPVQDNTKSVKPAAGAVK